MKTIWNFGKLLFLILAILCAMITFIFLKYSATGTWEHTFGILTFIATVVFLVAYWYSASVGVDELWEKVVLENVPPEEEKIFHTQAVTNIQKAYVETCLPTMPTDDLILHIQQLIVELTQGNYLQSETTENGTFLFRTGKGKLLLNELSQ